MLALQPERVIPGHFLGTEPKGTQAVTFTRDYVQRFEQALATAKNSDQLIDGLKKAFSSLPVDDGLAILLNFIGTEAHKRIQTAAANADELGFDQTAIGQRDILHPSLKAQ